MNYRPFSFSGKFLLLVNISALSAAAFILTVILYIIFAFILGLIPANSSFVQNENNSVLIFISSNGVHTDVVLPVQNKQKDWFSFIDVNHYRKSKKPFQYISFGWGDKGFYLETPTWAELKVKTALIAVFLPSSTAMHVSLYDKKPAGENVRSILITEDQYELLIQYITDSFKKDSLNLPQRIPSSGYDSLNDNFYEANGYYHLFKTCNSWTNGALKILKVRSPLWSPFDRAILYQLGKIK